jgi:hypothetical protein
MSAAELKELRKEVKKYIDHADERMVNIVYALLEADHGPGTKNAEHSDLTPEQEVILDHHIDLYEKGLMKFSSWEEARARITSKTKNAI